MAVTVCDSPTNRVTVKIEAGIHPSLKPPTSGITRISSYIRHAGDCYTPFLQVTSEYTAFTRLNPVSAQLTIVSHCDRLMVAQHR
jgi:hypothetical protein